MKLSFHRLTGANQRGICVPNRGRQNGSAAIVVIALLAIVLLYIGSTLQTLHHLNREIKLVERIRVANDALAEPGVADKLWRCQEIFGCAVFQAVGVNSPTRLVGH
jgi:hypothetical protein